MSGTLVNAFSSTRLCTSQLTACSCSWAARRQSAADAPREWPYSVKKLVGKRDVAKTSAAVWSAMRPAWVGHAAVDVQYERGAGARIANDGMAFNRTENMGMRCSGFPAFPTNANCK